MSCGVEGLDGRREAPRGVQVGGVLFVLCGSERVAGRWELGPSSVLVTSSHALFPQLQESQLGLHFGLGLRKVRDRTSPETARGAEGADGMLFGEFLFKGLLIIVIT